MWRGKELVLNDGEPNSATARSTVFGFGEHWGIDKLFARSEAIREAMRERGSHWERRGDRMCVSALGISAAPPDCNVSSASD
ncbi:hypothetical protein [Rhodococcus erythropolis]|uniref:hypothetical protein n=1 Tax=Rhodococcus erythropolis TaxID=1833 RepID=UPI00114D1463|nr:hypothetical protein [Rhodococcus erythropolis]